MKRIFLIYITLFSIGYGQNCAQEVDWCFDISTMQSFYFFIDVSILDEEIESGSVQELDVWQCPENDCDIIGAFYNNVCVGWTYPVFNNGYTIPVMLNDGNLTEYLSIGDIPEFRLYDRSSGIIYDGLAPQNIPGCYNNSFEIVEYLVSDGEWEENINYYIELFEGQNLISFFSLPHDKSIENVMQPIVDNVIGVIGEGIVASHQGNGNWAGSLSNLSIEKGYWVRMIDDDTLFVSGKPELEPEMTVYLGNNLISFPIDDTVSIAQAIPDNVEDSFEGIIAQSVVAQNTMNNNNQNDEYWVGSLAYFESKRGYWVKIRDDDIDYTTPVSFYFNDSDDLGRVHISQDRRNEFDYIQSIEQAFYFIDKIDGVDLTENDWILAYNKEQIVGARKWSGGIIDVPTMGQYDELTNGYLMPGDAPSFYIYNENLDDLIKLNGDIPGWTSNGIFNIDLFVENRLTPQEFMIQSTYPNPFNPTTTIEYSIPQDCIVNLSIYDINGRFIIELENSSKVLGSYKLEWDASNQSSGLYFVKLIAGEYQQTQKLMLIK